MNLKHKENYQIRFDCIDFNGKMSLNGISSYMQIIAANHATLLGFNYYKNSSTPEYYWILSRVKYVINEYPKWEESLEIETYPAGYDKLFAVRRFDLYGEGGVPIGYIIGDYILMDSERKRPVRIKGNKGKLAFLDFPYEGEALDKLKVPEVLEEEIVRIEKRKAYYSEMDLNEHMNNAHYIRWSVDMLPLELLKVYEISSLEINYNTSITCGVEVEIQLVQVGDAYMVYGNSLDHQINYFVAKINLRKIAQ